MKKNFITFCRISVIALLLAIVLLLIVFATSAETEEIPSVIGIFFVLSVIAGAISWIGAVIIDIIQSYKESGLSFLKGYIGQILFMAIFFVAYEYLIVKDGESWVECLVSATVIATSVRAGSNVIFTKRDKVKRQDEKQIN